jgi:hypothetical protein
VIVKPAEPSEENLTLPYFKEIVSSHPETSCFMVVVLASAGHFEPPLG